MKKKVRTACASFLAIILAHSSLHSTSPPEEIATKIEEITNTKKQIDQLKTYCNEETKKLIEECNRRNKELTNKLNAITEEAAQKFQSELIKIVKGGSDKEKAKKLFLYLQSIEQSDLLHKTCAEEKLLIKAIKNEWVGLTSMIVKLHIEKLVTDDPPMTPYRLNKIIAENKMTGDPLSRDLVEKKTRNLFDATFTNLFDDNGKTIFLDIAKQKTNYIFKALEEPISKIVALAEFPSGKRWLLKQLITKKESGTQNTPFHLSVINKNNNTIAETILKYLSEERYWAKTKEEFFKKKKANLYDPRGPKNLDGKTPYAIAEQRQKKLLQLFENAIKPYTDVMKYIEEIIKREQEDIELAARMRAAQIAHEEQKFCLRWPPKWPFKKKKK